MSGDEHKDDMLFGGMNGDTAVIRVAGRGSFKTSPAMKRFAMRVLDDAQCRRLVFDMADCVSMDSTFMGVVAGVALRTRKAGTATVMMINLSAKTLSLLQTLGLDRLLEARETGDTPAEVTSLVQSMANMTALGADVSDRLTSVETMLHAHEDLIRADDANRSRFGDVIDYLGKDLRNLKTDKS